MGPVIIFDKSVLQSLNPDEAMWLDNFYISNITPLFFIETLADLEKEIKQGRTPEEVVGNLAYKTPDMNSKPNAHHVTLLDGELFEGAELDMKYGRPHITSGRHVELEGRKGVIFEPSPEEEALSRWQKHEFLDLERLRAKAWRRGLSNINLKQNYDLFQRFFPIGKPKSLSEVKKLVDFYINETDQETILKFGLSLVGLSIESQAEVITRWRACGRQVIKIFAPYFTHVFSVDLFFYIAIAADLIGHGRPSHKIDLAYLYYLPFCKVFTSKDKLHADIVPFFLSENQTYIPGEELKTDLAKLDQYYQAFSDEIKKRGVMSFAFYPPDDPSFLITRLWDKYMNPEWRKHKMQPRPQPENNANKEMRERIDRLRNEGVPIPNDKVGIHEPDELIIERHVLGRKGKWDRFPPEVMNRRKNEKGEWEDIEKGES